MSHTNLPGRMSTAARGERARAVRRRCRWRKIAATTVRCWVSPTRQKPERRGRRARARGTATQTPQPGHAKRLALRSHRPAFGPGFFCLFRRPHATVPSDSRARPRSALGRGSVRAAHLRQRPRDPRQHHRRHQGAGRQRGPFRPFLRPLLRPRPRRVVGALGSRPGRRAHRLLGPAAADRPAGAPVTGGSPASASRRP